MKYQTLLFGAGQGSLKMMRNLGDEYDFIGYIDNDLDKVGNLFGGLPVYSPQALGEIGYDKIIISTQWALPVEQQLIHELGVDPKNIILPQKKVFKTAEPFSNPQSLILGRVIIIALNQLALEAKIPLVMDFGTLLGLTRDADIIPWDDDIDLSAPIEYAEQLEALLQAFCAASIEPVQWKVSRLEDKNKGVAGLLLDFADPSGNLITFTTSLCFRRINNGNAEHLPSLGMWYAPEQHFTHTGQLVWRGETLQVPFKHEEYLSFLYGQWQTPKKDIQLSDYAHINDVPYAQIKQADFSSLELELSQSRITPAKDNSQ